MNAEKFGGLCPPQLMRRMRQLLGPLLTDGHNDIIHELFVQRLPSNPGVIFDPTSSLPQDIIAAMPGRTAEHWSVDVLAERTDATVYHSVLFRTVPGLDRFCSSATVLRYP